MKYLFSTKISFAAKTNLDKVKILFSSFGEIKDFDDEIYNRFSGIKIENIFNGPILIEEQNQEVNFKCDLYFLDCAFIYCSFQIDTKEPVKEDEFFTDSFMLNKRKEFSHLDINSIGDIPHKFVLNKYYDFSSFSRLIDNVDLDMNSSKKWDVIFKSIKEHTCIIPNRYSFNLLASSGGPNFREGEEVDIDNLIVDLKKIKIWKNNKKTYFKGDIDKLIKIDIHKNVLSKKLDSSITQLQSAINDLSDEAKMVIKKISNKNPAYWEDLSLTIEVEQLFFIEVQQIIYDLLGTFISSSQIENYYTPNFYKRIKEESDKKIELIFSLAKQVDIALINLSTPIKTKNDYKLQESTDKVNDRILFLSFVAMSVPLISWVTSSEIANNIKFLSGSFILFLPIVYYVINTLYKKHNYRKNKLNIFKDDLKIQYKEMEEQQKKLKQIESYDEEKKKLFDFHIGAHQSNIDIHKTHIRKLKEKIKKL